MQKTTLKVAGMSCQHCVAAVTKAVSLVPGVKNVTVSLKDGTASFEYGGIPADLEKIKAAITDQGYDAA
ncbi:MAG: copper ion binding protein [Spirochaetaceae bacterium]|jgi:copper chaperone|nr:copper ion binding protein [Spirochaetaceae bacterium]